MPKSKASSTRVGKAHSQQRSVRPPARYIHTINGRPARYDGDQICYALVTIPINTCESLKQIRREEKATVQWRASKGFDNTAQYGHMRVLVA